MKVLITTCALSLLFSIFTLFQYDCNQLQLWQERIKWEADNAADAAALYFEPEQFAKGIKVFNKTEGNKATAYVLKNNLDQDGDGVIRKDVLGDRFEYYIYYFDGNGIMTTFKENTEMSESTFEFPYSFTEDLTGYAQTITEATVIVTIDAGAFNYTLTFIEDPDCIRTSGYEYYSYN